MSRTNSRTRCGVQTALKAVGGKAVTTYVHPNDVALTVGKHAALTMVAIAAATGAAAEVPKNGFRPVRVPC